MKLKETILNIFFYQKKIDILNKSIESLSKCGITYIDLLIEKKKINTKLNKLLNEINKI